jgi:uncharacterized protein
MKNRRLQFWKNNFSDRAIKSGEQVKLAIKESYKRLLSFSLETELRIAGKDEADKEAVRVFAENLRQLLLAAPFGEKRVLAMDPGFRTWLQTGLFG